MDAGKLKNLHAIDYVIEWGRSLSVKINYDFEKEDGRKRDDKKDAWKATLTGAGQVWTSNWCSTRQAAKMEAAELCRAHSQIPPDIRRTDVKTLIDTIQGKNKEIDDLTKEVRRLKRKVTEMESAMETHSKKIKEQK